MKNLTVLLFALFLSGSLFGQVKFNLSYEPNGGVYTLSIIPETSWQTPRNIVGAAQVVLRVAADAEFTPNITSLIPELVWADNAYIEHPDAAPAYTFVCIALASGPTDKIAMSEGQEVPLFSFTNAGASCAGLVELIPNDDPVVQAVLAEGFNVTQHLAVLGARGNAFSGIVNGSADCTATSGNTELYPKIVDDVQVSPVPAVEEVVIRWGMQADFSEHLDLVITDNGGREVFRQKVSAVKGENTMKIIVKNWKSGIYRISFQFSNGHRTKAWNMVVMH